MKSLLNVLDIPEVFLSSDSNEIHLSDLSRITGIGINNAVDRPQSTVGRYLIRA